ncbi:MAG: hypothetical protein ACI9KR_001419 [Arcticibacterium sp.]|jgi:hypothetical protein
MRKMTFILSLTALFYACKENKSYQYLPESIGQVQSILVVMEDSLWQGAVGDSVRKIFLSPLKGLSVAESSNQIQHVPPSVFKGTVKQNRTVLAVGLDSIALAHIKKDVYSRPQRVGVVKGRNEAEIISQFQSKAMAFVKSFKDLEITQAQARFSRSLNQEKGVENLLGISVSIPSAYRLGKQTESFVWLDRAIPAGSTNIIAYSLKGDSFEHPESFVVDIVAKRDSVLKGNIPGPDIPGKTTYMKTETVFMPYVTPVSFGGYKGVEVRGIWEISGYPMAGPFVSYILNDPKQNRKIVIEGFVFAPNKEKRDYLFELEAIIKTIKPIL